MKVQKPAGKIYQVTNLNTYEILLTRAESPLGALLEVVPWGSIVEDNLSFRSGEWCVSKFGKGERVRP